ncbi:MAG: hypothetical protein M0P61_00030 [Ignavibacteriaceae bacterium]|jgi:hypothetical protein|nr:hypothetical protein [Ignavibacteriaceae bacterium]
MPKRKDLIRKLLKDSGIKDVQIAKMLDMTAANFSYHMAKEDIDLDLFTQILKTLEEKKGIKITVPPTQSYTVHDESFQKHTEGEGMHGNFVGEPREYNYNGITSTTLERVIKPYEDLIEMLKLQLAEKERRIKELEEKLTNKKRGVP